MVNNRTVRSAATLLFSVFAISGCTPSFSEGEIQEITMAYSEMLIARNMGAGDSLRIKRLVDSTLKAHGVAGEEEMMEKMKILAKEPESLRAVLDSAQRRLERIQQGEMLDTLKK